MDHNSFSARVAGQKIEIVPPDAITPEIKVCLWNLLSLYALDQRDTRPITELVYNYLGLPIDEVSTYPYKRRTALKSLFFSNTSPWHYCYDFFEKMLFGFRYGQPGYAARSEQSQLYATKS